MLLIVMLLAEMMLFLTMLSLLLLRFLPHAEGVAVVVLLQCLLVMLLSGVLLPQLHADVVDIPDCYVAGCCW